MKRRFAILTLIAVSIAVGLLLWLWKSEVPASPLPMASDVESMTAQRIAYSPERLPSHVLSPPDRPTGNELPDFPVSRSHITKILDSLQPSRAIDFEKEDYSPWIIVGKLILKCKSGSTFQVDVYLTPDDQPGAFGVFGIDPTDKTWGKYRAGKSHQAWAALIDAYVDFRSQKRDSAQSSDR